MDSYAKNDHGPPWPPHFHNVHILTDSLEQAKLLSTTLMNQLCANIRISRETQCLPYAGFFKEHLCLRPTISLN